MNTRDWCRCGIVSAALAAAFATTAAAQTLFEFAHGGTLHEEQSRFLPGIYYFHKGNEYSAKHDAPAAVEAWTVAAGWAMKEAQYNLGISWFEGEGVAVDRPRGLAWLALAAEREDASFSAALATAWSQATAEEHDLANVQWRELKRHYGDAVALPRAEARFTSELNQITGSRVGMPGHVRVSLPGGQMDGATFSAELKQLAEVNFGTLPTGTVDVGPLRSTSGPATNER
jgi:TPR repeat protein